MSQHDIEDLVEESARAVLSSARDAAAKRRFIGALYAWQGQYDTGDTFGRLATELNDLGFDQEQDVQPEPLLSLAATMMRDASTQEQRQLVHHWLSALTDAIDEELADLTELGGSFEAFIQRDDAQDIRRLAHAHDVYTFRSNAAYRRLNRWEDIRSHYQSLDARTLDRKYILRWLMDWKKAPEQIVTAYQEERTKIARLGTSAIHDLPVLVPARGPFTFVTYHLDGPKRLFTFAVGEPPSHADETRLLLELEHNLELNILAAYIYVQSGLLTRWKGLEVRAAMPDRQFRRDLFQLIPEDRLASDKSLHDYGGWKYKLDQSRKVLEQRLDSMLGYWPHAAELVRFHAVPMAQRLAEGGLDTLERQRKENRDAHGWFVNDIELMFAHASAEWERGGTPSATIAAMAARLPYVVDRYPEKGEWTAGLEKLKQGPWYPPTPTRYPYRAVDPDEPRD